ncbi:MAG: hypothetical protein AAB337_03555 [Patescibacteria group bacterium]
MSFLVGHQAILDLLKQMHERGRLNHALLFVGPKHVGKRTLAEHLLFSIHHLQPSHPDFLIIERQLNDKGKLKQNISIDQIRELRSRLQMSSLGAWKVAVIDEAETLSIEATNALLKTLEEPTAMTQLILLVTHLSTVPATIASRCQVVDVPFVSHMEMATAFGEVLARRAVGRPGLAMRLKEEDASSTYEQQSGAWQRLMKATLSQKLGLLQRSLKQWDGLELLDVWEREAHQDFVRQPTRDRAEILRRMMVARLAILGNVNNALAMEQIIF